MDFALTADQRLMQDSIAGVLSRVAPLERVRAFANSGEAVASDVWAALTDFGVPGMLLGQAHGGLGLTLLDAALAAEVLGEHATPSPFLGSAVLAPLALTLAGSPTQQEAWGPKLAAGEVIAGVAMHEAIAGARDGTGVTVQNWRLSGQGLFAIDAVGADILVVADSSCRLHLVEARSPGIEIVPLATIDSTRRFAEARFDGADAEPLEAAGDSEVLERLRDAAFVILAADMLGASQAMLDKAVAYAKERRQFGRPIGSFQAVKHMCAEMAAELEPARALVWYAAYAFDAVPAEAALMAAHAKAHLADISRFVARTATEAHGGIGFTDLLGLHFWFKRVGVDRQLLGGPEQVRARAAAIQGLAPLRESIGA
ncbi:MAG TPA: acyl-CoA dehydrogenase [Caulobacteraceae bacterium]|jgi:alkylation response protein AidB-like acyl-CoA dehydrogenase